MRIVKLDELDDEERKRILQEQQQRIEQNNLERANIEQRASQAFKDSVQKSNSSNIASKILNGTGFVAKKTGVGVASGALGIAQSQITEMANNANKGKADSLVNLASNSIKSILGISNPMQFANNLIKGIPSYFKETVENVNDKSKTGLEKVITQGLNVNTNIINSLPVKQMIDSNSQILGKINPNASNALMSVNDRIQAPINKANEKLAEESQNYGKITNLLGNAGQSVGNMVPSIVTSILTQNPTAGLTTMGLSAKGQATQEALNKGVDLDKAIKIGNAKGMIEIGTEMLTGGVNIFGKGALDDIVERGILDKVKNNVAKFFVKQGLNASGEVLEETISDIAGNLIDKGTVDPNASYSLNDWKDTAITTVLTTAILNTLTGGIAGDVNQIKQENKANQNAQEWIQKAKNITNENQDNKLIDQQTKTAQNGLSQEKNINDIGKYEYQPNDNAKIDNFRKDANKYWDNSDKTKSLVNTIEKVMNDKDYNIRLDGTIKNNNGQSVNAQIKTLENGEVEIKINPNSQRVGEFLLTHEITHAIETQEIKDLIIDHASKNQDFNQALESLKQTYGTDEVSSEVVADISGQLLGNQEFINNLSMEKPNVFKRIYNKIIELTNKITGNTNEALFLKDLKNKWEEAYRTQNNNLQEGTQYAIKTDAKGYKYVKADRQVISGNDPEVWKSQTQKYINDQIRKNKDVKVYAPDGTELTITKNTAGKATFRNEVRQADGTIRKLTDEEFASKLRAETHIDELGEVSRHKNGPIPDTKNHDFAKDGFTYRTAYFEDEDGQYYKITMSVGKNGEINTIYNVGKMQQAQKNRSKSTNSELKGSNGNNTANSRIAPINKVPQKRKNVNSDTTKYSMQESENNSGSFNLPKNNQNRLNELKSIDTSNMGFIERGKIKTEIRALEQGYNSIEEYKKAEQEKAERAKEEYEQRQKEKKEKEKKKRLQLEKDIKESTPLQNAQFEIIQNTNPMLDDYHTGIRSPKDIKTFDEVINDEESFVWGDFSKEDAEQALEKGKITIYSSYPIENGTFVSTSKVQAEDYAGGRGKKIYSKEVPLQEVAWINGDEGQYAKVYNIQKVNTLEDIKNKYKNEVKYLILNEHSDKITIDNMVIKEELRNNGIGQNILNDVIDYANKNNKIITLTPTTEFNTKNRLKKWYKKNGFVENKGKNINFMISDTMYRLPDSIKFSMPNNNWQEHLEKNYPAKGTRTNLQEIRQVAPIGENVKRNNSNKAESIKNIQSTEENEKIANILEKPQEKINLPTNGEIVDWNEIERPEDNKKFRKHYKSIIESNQTTKEAKSIARKLMGTDTYIPETNKGQLIQADQRISNSDPQTELKSLLSKAINGDKISSVDIAIGERLIQYYSKTGNKQQLQEAIQATALAGTTAGQTVQAFSLLNHQTPQGQATWIQRSVDKMNNELAKKKCGTIKTDENGNKKVINKQGQDITNKVNLFDLTPEMLQKIINSTEENMWKNIDEVYEELGQQVPKSMIEKLDSWRYFSMLANIRTHARNMIGNFAMGKTQGIKNKVAGAIEGVVSQFNPNMERTHTLALTDKKTKQFSKSDFKNPDVQSRLELNENKYNPQSRLQNARKTFKNDFLENTLGKLFNLNDTLLEAEDGLGLKAGYINAMNEYLTANKIDVDKITDAQLNKARNYAVEQAKEATFHQANSIASAINQFQNKNGLTKFAVDAILPFKKTPMNVAKAGMEYSPLQIAKSATLDLANLRKGNITINQYIDNLSKGLTGTGIAFAGYALAKAGILKASGSDDKDKEKYDEEQGKQSYSITIGGKTYSLDWLAPTGIPLFIGAEFQKLTEQGNKEESTEKTNDGSKLSEIVKSVANVANAGATAINPMSEMSMISGLTSVLSSYNKDNALGDMMTNAGKSYINQFVPTLLGQVAKTTDDYERTTTSTKTGTIEKAVDQTINQIKNKVPGLRQTLPVKTDIWGKDKETEPNLPLRAFNSFINPATVKNISTDNVDKELNKLYEVNSNSSILPDILQKTLTIDNQKYRLTNKEYADYTKKFGETSYNLIKDLISSSEYKTMTQIQKEEAISNIYSYAKEANKIDYANKNGAEVKPTTLYNTMESLKKNGGKQSDYLNYLSKTKGIEKEKEKNQILVNSDYSNKTKDIIYSNGTGKNDKLYSNLNKITNVNINAYLNYKLQDISGDEDEESDVKGKTVSGSKKSNVISYLNKSKLSGVERLYIYGKSYKYTAQQKQQMIDYIKKANLSSKEQLEVYKGLTANIEEHKDGKYYWK